MATIALNYRFTGGVTKNTAITVLGEDATALSADSNKDITISVEEMNALLTITEVDGELGSGVALPSDDAEYPKLTFSLAGVEQKIKDEFLAAPSVAAVLNSEAYTTDSNAWLASIPHEAIKSVSVGAAMPTYDNKLFTANEVAKGSLSSDGTTLAFAVQNLFEQVINANRLQPLAAGRTVATKFVAGDKLKIYVTNTIGKSRTYSLDGAAAGQTATAKFKFGADDKTLSSSVTIACDANTTTQVSYTLVAA